ncbi:TetR/AcrR family transcriptional regulator [Priestia taiwanensis]|uniref:TetR family transcriptional regulator n=1 Tax=Priestia taiwanensis TaxID=1347902 RepID=A0A917ASZ0_9BACI|nr:TetR/AcrR family transcriptional regulator [Priestia taiwanensis]MBM7364185.1 AcrR family transcriptional regulator [Priestia taiwanensis]GGE72330.1 TetR family transcriptional regulator [Priestia taiwanensis]
MSFDRKQAILDAATASFAHFGYKATTMDHVAKAAKVGKGTIYTFFKNKDELFFEITKGIIHDMKIVATDAIDAELSFLENTHRVLYALLEMRKTSQITMKLIHEAKEMGTPTVIEMINRIDHTVQSIVKEKLQLAIDKKKIKPCDLEVVSFLVVKVYNALLFDWEENHPALTSEQVASIFETYIVNGLATTK